MAPSFSPSYSPTAPWDLSVSPKSRKLLHSLRPAGPSHLPHTPFFGEPPQTSRPPAATSSLQAASASPLPGSQAAGCASLPVGPSPGLWRRIPEAWHRAWEPFGAGRGRKRERSGAGRGRGPPGSLRLAETGWGEWKVVGQWRGRFRKVSRTKVFW